MDISFLSAILLLLGLIVFVIIWKPPDFFFWVFLTLFFDPGGFQAGYFESNIISTIDFSDFFFILMMLTLFSRKVDKSIIYKDKRFFNFIKYFFFIQIYFIVVYGIITPAYQGKLDFAFFLIKNRMFFMSFFILIATYIFSMRSIKIFFNMVIFSAVICLTLFWLTLVTGIDLVPYLTWDRYVDSGIIRYSMYSYGLFDIIFPVGLIVFFLNGRFKSNIKYRNWIYFAAMLMAWTLFMTLTRREFFYMIFTAIVLILIIPYIFRISRLKLSTKIIIPGLLIPFLLWISFPQYIEFMKNIFNDMYALAITGRDVSGIADYRIQLSGPLIYAKQTIKDNPLFGTGYIPVIFAQTRELVARGDEFMAGFQSSAEVPIYGAFLRMGIIGVLIYTPVYIMLIKLVKRLLKIIKNNKQLVLHNIKVELILTVLIIGLIIGKFTIQIFQIYREFIEPNIMCGCVVLYAILFSNRIKILTHVNSINQK